MATGRAILQTHVDGLLPETIPYDVQWTLTNGIGTLVQTSLGSGDNTLTVPAGTKLIILIPPTNSAATLVWSKTGGTTNGITQLPNAPNIISWNAGAVIVNASVSVNPVTILYLG